MSVRRRGGRGRAPRHGLPLPGLAMLTLLALIQGFGLPWIAPLRTAWLDLTQRLSPRPFTTQPAIIVDIDEESLARHGQWPWPRTLIADLVRAIGRHGPAAIGLDVLMPEPDRLSPQLVLQDVAAGDPVLAARLAALPNHDSVLAAALAATPSVLIVATAAEATGRILRAPPIAIEAATSGGGGDARLPLPRATAVVPSIDLLGQAVLQRAELALGGQLVARDGDVDALRDGDRVLTDARHVTAPSRQ